MKIDPTKLRITTSISWPASPVTEQARHKLLIDSIRHRGLLRPPTVTPDLVVIDGVRRVKAAIEAGLTEINIQVIEVTESQLRDLFIHANKREHQSC